MTINPDSTLSFPPFADCSAIGCITFSTFSNTIVAWSGGRYVTVNPSTHQFISQSIRPSVNTSTSIYQSIHQFMNLPTLQYPIPHQHPSNTLSPSPGHPFHCRGPSSSGLTGYTPVIYMHAQKIGDGSMLGGVDATAYHILFDSFLDPISAALQTFSISLYDDHSIRFQYHKASKTYVDVRNSFFGLWGSRASRNFSDIFPNTSPNNPSSYLRYHMENISTNVVVANGGGNNVLFCYQSQVLGCLVDACVGPSKPLVLRWGNDTGFPSCQAAGMGQGQVHIQCVWAGKISYLMHPSCECVSTAGASSVRSINMLYLCIPSNITLVLLNIISTLTHLSS